MKLALSDEPVLAIDADNNGDLVSVVPDDYEHTILDFEDDKSKSLSPDKLMQKLLTHEPTDLKILPSPMNSYKPITTKALESAILSYTPYFSNIFVDLSPGYIPLLEKVLHLPTSHKHLNLEVELIVVVRPDQKQYKRVKELAMKINQSFSTNFPVHIVVNQSHEKDDLDAIRYLLQQYRYSVSRLPYSDDFESFMEKPPLFANPNSDYSKALGRFLEKNLGIDGESDDEDDDVEPSDGLFAKFIGRLGLGGRR
jgi:hypothetical protein